MTVGGALSNGFWALLGTEDSAKSKFFVDPRTNTIRSVLNSNLVLSNEKGGNGLN
jgi:hypothetical protein